MKKVYLLLGSNLGDRYSNISKSIDKINERVGVVTEMSSVYETEPWGTEDNLPFLNVVLSINTFYKPVDLLTILLKTEAETGRIRNSVKNAPRVIDIDILLYADAVIQLPELVIPHERMHLRRFVLIPMVELNPLLVHPLMGLSMKELLEQCTDTGWVKKYNDSNTDV